MNVTFLYTGPHYSHATWAKSVGAKFVHNKKKIRTRYIGRFMRLLTVIKEIPKNTDVLLCEGGSDILAGHRWKKQNPTKKLALIVDDPKLYFLPKMNKLKKRLYTNALKSVDLFISTTPLMKSFIPKRFYPKSKIVPLYVDYKHFCYRKTNLNNKNIIFVGAVDKPKGVDKIIRVFKKVNQKYPESKLYIIGEGALKGKSSRNIMFTGYQSKPERYMRMGSIYINLARIEPFGIAILEAMSCGLVPIVTEGVGLKYAVRKISPELVVKNEDNAVRLIEKIFGNGKLRKKYSQKARQIAKNFTKEKSIKMFKKALYSL